MISGGIKRDQWHEWVKEQLFYLTSIPEYHGKSDIAFTLKLAPSFHTAALTDYSSRIFSPTQIFIDNSVSIGLSVCQICLKTTCKVNCSLGLLDKSKVESVLSP